VKQTVAEVPHYAAWREQTAIKIPPRTLAVALSIADGPFWQ
jgi:hypothetical protein